MTVEQAKDMIEFQTKMAVSSGDKIEQLEKEKAELKKKIFVQNEIIIGEQTEIEALKHQVEKLTKMLDMAIDDIYNETLVIHRTKEEFIDIYKSNLENKIMGETKDESISL